MPSRLAVLSYHKIGPPSPGAWETWFYVSLERFEQHLRWLIEHDWKPISLELFLAGLKDPSLLPPKASLITFDDGYRNLMQHAMPIMRKLNVPGIVFVSTDFVGGENEFDNNVEPTEPLCDWNELQELEKQGIAVQSHTASHAHLSEIDIEQMRRELRLSRDAIMRQLHRPVHTIAYPYGDDANASPQLHALLAELDFQAGFTYNGPAIELPTNKPWGITRLAMGSDSDLAQLLGS